MNPRAGSVWTLGPGYAGYLSRHPSDPGDRIQVGELVTILRASEVTLGYISFSRVLHLGSTALIADSEFNGNSLVEVEL